VQGQSKKNSLLALLGAAHSLNHSLFLVAPPLLTLIINDLGVTDSVIGAVAGSASLIYGVGSLVGGPLGDRIGEAKTITICLALSGLSAFIMFAAGFTREISVYALALILMAIWASFYHPTANSLISKAFKGRVAESMGFHGVGGTLGTVFTPTIAWFLGASFGWPVAFAAFGGACLLLALVFTRSFKNAENSRSSDRATIIDAFKIRGLWTLLIFNVAIGLFMKGVELFLPRYLQISRSFPPEWAAIANTIVLAAGVPGQWIGGKTADIIGCKKVLIFTSLGICLSFFSLLLAPIYVLGAALFITLYGLCFYGHQPALNSLTGFVTSPDQRGAVYGVLFFTSFGLGSLSQFAAGYVASAYGLDAAFYLLAAFALIAFLLSFKLPDKRENR
jgi:predicted MFS family arabinose efflux permease